MSRNLIFSICFFISFGAISQNSDRPRLVVGIVIDQMRCDYIYRYWDKYASGGFKRLVAEGYFCKNTNYNYVPTYTAPGHAAIYTGTTPAQNGIIANDWFDDATGHRIYCVTDATVTGVGSEDEEGRRSPKNIMTTTITDELRLATNMKSKVISISLKDRSAIIPGGHIANAAYWYDGSNGSFISSTYFMNALPTWVEKFNKQNLPGKYLSQDWETLMPIETYTESLPDDNAFESTFSGEQKPVFPHHLKKLMKTNGELNLIRSTPFGNSLLKDFAIETISSENMGKSATTDFIAISFSSTDYVGHAYGPNSVEAEDTYLRLDKEIAALLDFIDSWVGKKNTLVFLTADHGAIQIPEYLMQQKLPAGYVNEQQISDSLKKYLNNQYGNPLVLDYFNQQIYLDHQFIASKKLVPADVENKVAAFLATIPEVTDVLTASALNRCEFTEGPRALMQRGFNSKRSGDVLVNYL
ncbi:MAG TPA: alkaline phosphatase PafA, partial [Bacteroidia bacterium]|nr:alkaline phosphatase PafA [Bacteroidia bacterium]